MKIALTAPSFWDLALRSALCCSRLALCDAFVCSFQVTVQIILENSDCLVANECTGL